MENEMVLLIKMQYVLAQGFYFIFLSLIFGLSLMLAMMESVHFLTGNAIFQKMIQFWGKFFAMNLIMGLIIGFLMQWQFGPKWHDYAGLLGDIFCLPGTLVGKLALMGEAILMGLFFFGWRRFEPLAHLGMTWLMALGANFCAVSILLTQSSNVPEPSLQLNFIHTIAASYILSALFVLGISSYYLFKKSEILLASKSLAIAVIFGVTAVLMFLMLGNETQIFTADSKMAGDSSVPVMISLSGFMFLYVLLILKFAKWGPSRLVIKHYHFECT